MTKLTFPKGRLVSANASENIFSSKLKMTSFLVKGKGTGGGVLLKVQKTNNGEDDVRGSTDQLEMLKLILQNLIMSLPIKGVGVIPGRDRDAPEPKLEVLSPFFFSPLNISREIRQKWY